MTTEKNYEVAAPSGRTFIVRPLPMHFFLYYGELPSGLTEKAIEALGRGDTEAAGAEILKTISPDELKKQIIFVREAVNAICMKPRIRLSPQSPDEISPFEISEEDFAFLSKIAMSGGRAESLESFRSRPGETSGNRSDGKRLRRPSKLASRSRK